jgi:hypothetical protein
MVHGGACSAFAVRDLGRNDYFPQTVHGAEPGLLIGSIVLAVSHGILLVAASRSNPSS